MLNCGFTNIDVGTLLKSEVHLEEGRIIRQRTKTRRHEHPPLVSYQLWDEDRPVTAIKTQCRSGVGFDESGWQAALREQIGRGERKDQRNRLVFATPPLDTHEEAQPKISNKNPRRNQQKPRLPDKQLKYLRKTGSSMLRSDRRFFSLDSLYLGHAWVTIADKHYNAFDGQPYEPLDEAIQWLGQEFGVE